jgi:hypothetical protein
MLVQSAVEGKLNSDENHQIQPFGAQGHIKRLDHAVGSVEPKKSHAFVRFSKEGTKSNNYFTACC